MAKCNSYLHLVRGPRSEVGQVGFFRVGSSYFLCEIPAGADFVNVRFVSDRAVNNFVAGHNSNTVLTVEAPSGKRDGHNARIRSSHLTRAVVSPTPSTETSFSFPTTRFLMIVQVAQTRPANKPNSGRRNRSLETMQTDE